jgi:hypothetical protein
MNCNSEEGSHRELCLVKLYMELTGATEARARSVFMYIARETKVAINSNDNGTGSLGVPESYSVIASPERGAEEPACKWNTLRAAAVPVASGA